MAVPMLKCPLSVYLIASRQNTPVASQPDTGVPRSQHPGNIAKLPAEPGPMNPEGLGANDFDMTLSNNDTLMIGIYPIGDGVFKLETSDVGESHQHRTHHNCFDP